MFSIFICIECAHTNEHIRHTHTHNCTGANRKTFCLCSFSIGRHTVERVCGGVCVCFNARTDTNCMYFHSTHLLRLFFFLSSFSCAGTANAMVEKLHIFIRMPFTLLFFSLVHFYSFLLAAATKINMKIRIV